MEWFEDGSVELYNLRGDPGEEKDLSEEEPERARELLERLREWRREVGANMPRVDGG